ncbi:MAG: carbohydrate kinase [Cohaesibacter sp.]|nr:carbohydrate kinase [Cohaesibacter sp.]
MILCCGEALIDMVPSDPSHKAGLFESHCGGAVFNTAIALGRLGQKTGLFTAVGQDQFGDMLRNKLSNSGASLDYLAISPLPTPLAFAHIRNAHVNYEFYLKGCAELTKEDFTALQKGQLPFEAFFFGGISLCAAPVADHYHDLAHHLAHDLAKDHFIMLDPNIRPAFIADEEVYRARLYAMMGLADVVKVSIEDLDWLAAHEPNFDKRLAFLRTLCSGLILLTKGETGAFLYGPDDLEIFVAAPCVKVKDPIGAGDSFNGGFLAALQEASLLSKEALSTVSSEARNRALQKALTMAVQVAALSVQKAGANPPWREEVLHAF